MDSSLPRISYLEAGIDPEAILSLTNALEASDIQAHSFMIVRHGGVAAAGWWKPYAQNEPHLLYSLTKSFTSTAAGFAVSEGLFGLDDLVIDHFPDLAPETSSENLKKLRVRHLLSMSGGHEKEPGINAKATDWRNVVKKFLAHPFVFEPGTHFVYNTPSTNMVSILIQRCSGISLDEFLQPRLLEPLGIRNTIWSKGPDWTWGGSGLHAATESVAKLGLLYLNSGKWQGDQLLPEGWAQLASSAHVSNGDDPSSDWNQGYGFQFWRSRHGFRGDGAFGQFCLVLPEFDAVVAITSGESNMQKILESVWSQLLPGLDSTQGAASAFEVKLASLNVEASGPLMVGPSHLSLRNFENDFEARLENSDLNIKFGGHLKLTLGEWIKFPFAFGREQDFPAAAYARWASPTELLVKIVNLRTPQSQTISVSLRDEGAFVEFAEDGIFDGLERRAFIATRITRDRISCVRKRKAADPLLVPPINPVCLSAD